ncbi:MAG: hypothetical protein J2P24_10600 [Streptosporangiales bacterium]|nr:hypothetical protein [Streptosporangiales bacterium]MBO0889792.1 hypothetical protein [Acidothermales bacterium]
MTAPGEPKLRATGVRRRLDALRRRLHWWRLRTATVAAGPVHEPGDEWVRCGPGGCGDEDCLSRGAESCVRATARDPEAR